jgi:hypothetical protein
MTPVRGGEAAAIRAGAPGDAGLGGGGADLSRTDESVEPRAGAARGGRGFVVFATLMI